ncbi:MAG: PaaI family thioesterase [Alphaproteobacteria bacterium]|nr:PaaI family thioesterase [Alphaproteobacteria bacterium]MBU1512558.1 PaaI family thioesterase [Alphaproteobacteria bacterium]MBU2092897.1 PaaI family thioesterase [Alphaproteobacteria bacterium]MBU2150864.1 PaaI family thioesterase [Alphaproteobacteria bacterium]MBU2307925.1 PaaI family thioesterase [Alphaproteobacteria bacterium]
MTWATERLDAIKQPDATAPPVVVALGLGLIDDWGPGWVRKTWTPDARLLNGDGSLFGGYIAALADQVAAFAAMTVVPDEAQFRTVNLQVQFVKIGRGHPLTIEGRVVAASKRLITVEATFRRPDGELIATASAQQITLPSTETA